MPTDLVDPFGRVIRDLRISVTDRCNFRCTYCMPDEGMTWLPRSEVLTFEEIERVAGLMVSRYGVESIRLTGGEPTVRAHLPSLVARLAALPGPDGPIDLAMTTNGATLRSLAGELRDAGLRRVNISLDTLDRARFVEMTRRDELDHVLDGIDAAIEAGFGPVKINTVVQRDVNDDEIVDLATFGREHGVEVRFIEFMPLDASGGWSGGSVVGQDEIVAAHRRRVPARAAPGPWRRARRPVALPRRRRHGRRDPECDEAVLRRLRPGPVDRRRPAPDVPLRHRRVRPAGGDAAGESDDELAARIERAVGTKWAGHHINQVDFIRPARSMSQIGG